MTAQVALWVSLLAAPPVADEDRPVDAALIVPTDDPCLVHKRLAAHVRQWLGRESIDVRLEFEVFRDDDVVGFRLRIDDREAAERRLDPAPADCADLHAALGLAIALGADASVLESLGYPAQTVEPEPGPIPAAAEPAPIQQPPAPAPIEPKPKSTFRGAVDFEGVMLLGVFPRVAFGGNVGIDLGWVPWFDVRLGVLAGAGLPFPLAEGEVAPVLVAGHVGFCPRRSLGRLTARLCAGVAAGEIRAQGRDFSDSRTPRLPFFAVPVGGDLIVAVSPRIALELGADVIAPVVRPTYEREDANGEVTDRRTGATVGGAFGLGLAFRFP